jgi:serine/threonine-protein kinase
MEGRVVDRYVVLDEIAAGGMATVHLGRLRGTAGFSRTVALKCLHAHLAKDPELVTMFLDEAHIAGRIRHPNVVSTIDVVSADRELILVMEYVHGESVAHLMRPLKDEKRGLAPRMAATVVYDALLGLHAAHETTDEKGAPLHVVHRDVSPQNILVGADGVARVVDFGVAKAVGRMQTTRDGQIKGKMAYMAPEQLRGVPIDRRVDVYAASVVLWEMLAGRRLFTGESAEATLTQVLEKEVDPPSHWMEGIPPALDAIVMKGLSRDPDARFSTASEMAAKLEATMGREPTAAIAEWVQSSAQKTLAERKALVERIESMTTDRLASMTPHREEVGTARSVIGPSTTSRSKRAMWGWAIAIVIVGVGGTIVGVRMMTTTSTTSASTTPTTSATPSSVPTPSASEIPTTIPATPSAPPPQSASATTIAKPPKNKPIPTAKTAAPNCNPPYVVDANGYHIPKPECLH